MNKVICFYLNSEPFGYDESRLSFCIDQNINLDGRKNLLIALWGYAAIGNLALNFKMAELPKEVFQYGVSLASILVGLATEKLNNNGESPCHCSSSFNRMVLNLYHITNILSQVLAPIEQPTARPYSTYAMIGSLGLLDYTRNAIFSVIQASISTVSCSETKPSFEQRDLLALANFISAFSGILAVHFNFEGNDELMSLFYFLNGANNITCLSIDYFKQHKENDFKKVPSILYLLFTLSGLTTMYLNSSLNNNLLFVIPKVVQSVSLTLIGLFYINSTQSNSGQILSNEYTSV